MAAAASSLGRSGALEITRRLAAICGPPFSRLGGPADEVAGRPARWVAVPGGPHAAAEVLRLAAAHDLAVVPRGAGTKIDWGATPVQVDIMLDTGRLAGIGHEPVGALVAEVGAGTPLRAVQATLERTGQRLAMDAPSPGATLGGVLAAGEAGPLSHRHGSPCDQLLGVRYLAADGELVSAGGGAPGLDLARLLCGSQGALGVLVSATLRVQPVPASRLWVSRPVWTPLEVHDLVRTILAARLEPAAIELDLPGGMPRPRHPYPPGHPAATARERHPSMSGRAGAPSRAGSLVVLLEGGPADVTERAERLVGLLHGEATIAHSAPTWWRRYRSPPATPHYDLRCRSATCTPPSTRCATRPARRCRCAGPPAWAWCTRHCPERWPPTGWRPSWPPSEVCCWPGRAGAWWSPPRRRCGVPSTSGASWPA